MSKLLKSKFFLGALIVAGLALATTASAAYTHSTTLKFGSKGAQVMSLQQALNATSCKVAVTGVGSMGMETTTFGAKTLAAVKCFQAANGLTADGIVGPMTGAKLAMGGTTGGGTLPAGCTSTAGYSPTTGVKCDTGSTGGSTGGPLQGGAGDIDLTAKSTYSNEEVQAGAEDAKVLAFEVEADDGSDVEITNVKVEFVQSAAGNSDNMDDYMESVSIWMGSKKVGESDVDNFSENSNYWSDTIALSGAVVEAGETETFVVAVSAINNLDSGDINDDAWEADLLNVRFRDAMGVTTTETADAAGAADGTFSRDFDFEDLATSGDLELKLALASGNPDAGSIEVDTVSTTDVDMLEFTLKAEGSDMTIDSMEFDASSTGDSDGIDEIASEFVLMHGNDELDTVAPPAGTTGTLVFTDLDFTIDEDDTETFTVMAKIREIAAGTGAAAAFDQGDSLTVSFTTANLDDTTNTDVEDENGDTVAAGDRTGSAIGEAQSFYSSGVMVDMGNVTYESVTDSGAVTQVTYTIPLSITAFGDTRYIGLAADHENDYTAIDNDESVSYAFQISSDPSTDIAEGAVGLSAIETWSCSATIEGSGYRLDEGVAKSCTLTVTLFDGPTEPGSYRVHVGGVQSYLDSALTNDATNELIQPVVPVEDFQTAFKLLTS